MLILTRKAGESFLINDEIELVVTEISGDQVKIGIKAPSCYKILRKELVQTIESNRQAAQGADRDTVRNQFSGWKRE